MKKYRNYSDDDIIKTSSYVTSLRQLLLELNLKPIGGNYANMKRNIQRLNINTSHWTGQGWNLDKQLKNYKDYTRPVQLKKHLIIKRGCKCEGIDCGISSWMGKPIVLELDHIDGNRTNNEETNLKLLCPNCHSQTPTWRGRKLKINYTSTT